VSLPPLIVGTKALAVSSILFRCNRKQYEAFAMYWYDYKKTFINSQNPTIGEVIQACLTKNFKGGTRHVIYPWNQSQIENRKSSSPRIYPWGQSKI
jgi:hypothetical protein